MLKRSKIDIGSIQKRAKPLKKIKHEVRREAFSYEYFFALKQKRIRQALEQLAFKPLIAKVKVKKQKVWAQLTSFALASLLVVGLLQTALYLSSAKKASGEILGAATSAYSELHSASKDLSAQNFSSAQQLFEQAQSNIKDAQDKLGNFRALTWLTPQANSADHVLKGASALALAGQKITTALDIFDQLQVSSKGVGSDFNTKVSENKALLAQGRDLVTEASAEFDQTSGLPENYLQSFNDAKLQVTELGSILKQLVDLEDLYLGLFSGPKTYLLIFQNTDEIRATGGFIGTYGVLETNQGSITKLRIESIYQLDGQIYEEIAAPGQMQPLIKRWGIRDANWFADFPTSASKLLYFFEKGGETADGVISATPALFEDLLKLVGPIDMPSYGVTLTAENFQEVVQYKTSVDYDKTLNQPKKMLADFAPLLLNRLTNLSKDQWFSLLQIFEQSLHSRSILLYCKDSDTEKQIDDLGFSGKLLATDYDYLSIVNTNLGGTKTDLHVNQQANLETRILSDGTVMDTLTLTRQNQADASNKDFLRILVPLGSQFISASGFDQYDYYASVARGLSTDAGLNAWDQGELHSDVFVRTENGKSEFSGWLNTDPGQEKTIQITYMLPFKASSGYSLLLQKQAASLPLQFEGSISLGSFDAKWLGEGLKLEGGIIKFSSNTSTDDFWPAVISK